MKKKNSFAEVSKNLDKKSRFKNNFLSIYQNTIIM